MKIVLTGSLGNVGRPLTRKLVARNHSVTVISSNPERSQEIASLGAGAAIGSIHDVEFLTQAFKGADIVYLMEAVDLRNFFEPTFDITKTYTEIASNYRQAIEASEVKKAVHLSSIGVHTNEGVGILAMHFYAEQMLRLLPDDVSVKFIRPVGFYTNLYRSMHMLINNGAFIFNHGGDQKEPWVSPLDIADVIAEEMEKPFDGKTFRYVASDEISPNEIAAILGNAIGKPGLKWLVVSDEEFLNGMLAAGMNEDIAKGFTQMHIAQGDGSMYEHYYSNRPEPGKVKFINFAKEFAAVYRSQISANLQSA